MRSDRQKPNVVQGTLDFEGGRASRTNLTPLPPASKSQAECLDRIQTNPELTKDEKILLKLVSTMLLSIKLEADRTSALPKVTFLDLTSGEKKEFRFSKITNEKEVHRLNASELRTEFLNSFKESTGLDLHEYLLKVTQLKFETQVEPRFFIKAYQALLTEGLKKIILDGYVQQELQELALAQSDDTMDLSFSKMQSSLDQRNLTEAVLADSLFLLNKTVSELIDCHYTHPNIRSAHRLFSEARIKEAENTNRHLLR